MDYLIPENKRFDEVITISANAQWATTLVGGYSGLHNEDLYKRAFFHLDARYPNGISMPVLSANYDKFHSDRGTFVEHPVHGWCYADEIWAKEKEKNKQYLRLYKMSDVLAEINKQLPK